MKHRKPTTYRQEDALETLKRIKEFKKTLGVKKMDELPAGVWGLLYDPVHDQFIQVEDGELASRGTGCASIKGIPQEASLLIVQQELSNARTHSTQRHYALEKDPVLRETFLKQAKSWWESKQSLMQGFLKKVALGVKLKEKGYRLGR